MASDEQWEIWYEETARKDFKRDIYKRCDEENSKEENARG